MKRDNSLIENKFGVIRKKLTNNKQTSGEGFTLIELLVVIAIISILVIIVIIAINPAERLREAADRRASTNVRASGTLIAACVTRQNGNLNNCDLVGEVESTTGGDGKLAVTSTFCTIGPLGNRTDLGMYEAGRTSPTTTYWVYKYKSGQVSSTTTAPTTTTC